MTRAATIALIVAAACDRRAPIASCRDDLTGVWVAGDARWMVLDRGRELEIYPLFADVPAPGALEIGPRVVDLERDGERLDGFVRRRFMRATATCTAKAAARVTRCSDDALELVLADPGPPLAFAPCRFARPTGGHIERWRRE